MQDIVNTSAVLLAKAHGDLHSAAGQHLQVCAILAANLSMVNSCIVVACMPHVFGALRCCMLEIAPLPHGDKSLA